MGLKIKKKGLPDKIPIDMTPMIDIVFQLLTFFVMTLKVATMEGDFNIKMPLAEQSASAPDDQLPPLTLRMNTDSNGNLTTLALNNRTWSGPDRFARLHHHIASVVGDGNLATSAEVTLDCDYGLRYEYVIEAISAVSGSVGADGQIIKLVEKIKFAPPRGGS